MRRLAKIRATDGVRILRLVTDNLFAQGIITEDLVSVSFEPTSVPEIVNGELTFGGTDSSKFSGSINFVYVPAAFVVKYWSR